jgi:hypothetical protein
VAYIESHQEISRHFKTKQCARTLGISVPAMVGHLHILWHWCLSFAQDGDLTRHSVEVISDEAMWEGDPQHFVGALIECGFIDKEDDGTLFIHDWEDYGGKLIERRNANAARMRKVRENGTIHSCETSVQRTCNEHAEHVRECAEREKKRVQESTQEKSINDTSSPRVRPTTDVVPALEESPLFQPLLEITDRERDYRMGRCGGSWTVEMAKLISRLQQDGRTVDDVAVYRAKLPAFLNKSPPDVNPPQPKQIDQHFDRVIAFKERKDSNGTGTSPTARKLGAILDRQNARRAAAGIAPRGEDGGAGNASLVPRTHGRT